MTDTRLDAPSRRRFLRMMGLGTAALGLAGCDDGAAARDLDPLDAGPLDTGPLDAGPLDPLDAAPDLAPDAALDPGEWWLEGIYRPTLDEHHGADLRIIGALPPELDGLYLRNGPNPHTGRSAHWFAGDGMLHGVRLGAGRAEWYRSRYVQTPYLRGDDTGPGVPPLDHHPANVSVIHHGGHLLALGETGLPYALSPADLATLGAFDYAGRLGTAMTAHPKIDPDTGRMHFFGYGFLPPFLTYHVAEPDGTLSHSAALTVPGPTMMHDCALTATRVVFLDLPVVFDIQLAIAGDDFPFRWRPEHGARLGVLPHDGTDQDIVWLDIDPCYIFHTLNAYDDPTDPDRLVLEAVRHPSMFANGVHDFGSTPQMWRYAIDLATRTVSEGPLDTPHIEFPAVDRRRWGRPHRYGYALGLATERDVIGIAAPDTLFRYTADGVDTRHTLADGYLIDEPTFVPAHPGAAEDEGWLVGYCHHPDTTRSELYVIQADAIAAGPIARVVMPRRVPTGTHGLWVPPA